MSVSITLNDELARRLSVEAESLKTSIDAIANRILERVFPPVTVDNDESLTELVARIRNSCPGASAMRPPLKNGHRLCLLPEDAEEFDEVEWSRQWKTVEAKVKAML